MLNLTGKKLGRSYTYRHVFEAIGNFLDEEIIQYI